MKHSKPRTIYIYVHARTCLTPIQYMLEEHFSSEGMFVKSIYALLVQCWPQIIYTTFIARRVECVCVCRVEHTYLQRSLLSLAPSSHKAYLFSQQTTGTFNPTIFNSIMASMSRMRSLTGRDAESTWTQGINCSIVNGD